MANIASSIKRMKTNEVRRQRNASMRSRMRTFIKKVITALEKKDVEGARTAFREAVPIIDSMTNKRIIHRNKAARHKSRLHARIKALDLAQAGQTQ